MAFWLTLELLDIDGGHLCTGCIHTLLRPYIRLYVDSRRSNLPW
jgi:hypothetical protein